VDDAPTSGGAHVEATLPLALAGRADGAAGPTPCGFLREAGNLPRRIALEWPCVGGDGSPFTVILAAVGTDDRPGRAGVREPGPRGCTERAIRPSDGLAARHAGSP
jgi:hypothetical protein